MLKHGLTILLGGCAIILAGCDMSPEKTPPTSVKSGPDEEDVVIPEPRPDVVTDRFARLALQCVHREYPNKISHVMSSDSDALPPSQLTPAFYGCFDWHSSVHGHWLLVRLLKTDPQSPMNSAIIAALDESFTPQKLEQELTYYQGEGRGSFERPYGIAWYLQLVAELHESDNVRLTRWRDTLRPLESAIVKEIKQWLPKLAYPIRLGTHNQSAFAFGLMLDYARTVGDEGLEKMLVDKSLEFHKNDVRCPLAYEPSGEDFLSPCLMEADLMRRVMDPEEYSKWLTLFLPQIPGTASVSPSASGSNEKAGKAKPRSGEAPAKSDLPAWLTPGIVRDPTDGKLVHLDGVNLSRAWALEGIASHLPSDDPRRAALREAAKVHQEAGLAAVSEKNYEGSHWLGSFATYLITERGIKAAPKAADEANADKEARTDKESGATEKSN